jgi:hypothetical protein
MFDLLRARQGMSQTMRDKIAGAAITAKRARGGGGRGSRGRRSSQGEGAAPARGGPGGLKLT